MDNVMENWIVGKEKNEHSQDIFNNNIVMICLIY